MLDAYEIEDLMARFDENQLVDSDDKDTQMRCMIAPINHPIDIFGGNIVPYGVSATSTRLERPWKYQYIEHAERVAIAECASLGIATCHARMCCTWYPCVECARMSILAGIGEIIVDGRDSNPWTKRKADDRWKESCDIALTMLEEAGVGVILYKGCGNYVFKTMEC